MKYSFITQHKNTYPIRLMCQVLGVDRSCYYHYRRQMDNRPVDSEHEEMLEWIQDIAKASDHSYGSRRMKKALNCLGYPVSRNKARNLMREAGVQVRHRKKYKVTTNSNHKQPVYDNLLQRQFDVPQPDQVYAADVTYGAPILRRQFRMLLSKLEHVWNAFRETKEELSWMPALCYGRARAEAAVTCCTLAG